MNLNRARFLQSSSYKPEPTRTHQCARTSSHAPAPTHQCPRTSAQCSALLGHNQSQLKRPAVIAEEMGRDYLISESEVYELNWLHCQAKVTTKAKAKAKLCLDVRACLQQLRVDGVPSCRCVDRNIAVQRASKQLPSGMVWTRDHVLDHQLCHTSAGPVGDGGVLCSTVKT
jgi:hypothetical protein